MSTRIGRSIAAGSEVALDAARAFVRKGTRRLAAGLAYYSLFALVPTLFLAVTIVATIFGREATDGRLVGRLDGVVGADAAMQLDEAVGDLWEESNATGFAIITAVLVLYSASILFVAWRDSLDAIWDVPYRSGLRPSLSRRAFGVLVPIAVGFLLVAIVLIEMLTAMAGDFVTSPLIDALIDLVSSFSPLLTAVVALTLLYRYSTRARPRWSDILTGAVVTAIALAVLAWGYGLYVRLYGGSSAAGAAGTVILGLVFVYLAAQVLLFGAELVGSVAGHRDRAIGRMTRDVDTAEV
ncbi:MAG: YihY/virulence factor BrkB family protein [Acidimicrobiia bacterium]|nr:YihY/virulence factor BrkB family protein [Acidimicrobiia bacterium]